MTDRFTATWPDPVAIGGTLYPVYSNPSLAGQTITIRIVDTGNGQVVELQMTLDANGNGSIAWAVPMDWGPFATLEGPDSEDHLVAVTGSAIEPAAAKKAKKRPPVRGAKKRR